MEVILKEGDTNTKTRTDKGSCVNTREERHKMAWCLLLIKLKTLGKIYRG